MGFGLGFGLGLGLGLAVGVGLGLGLHVCLISFPFQAELVESHAAALQAKDIQEREFQKQWAEALGHERDKRDRTYGIQVAQFASDLKIAERKIEREWKTISGTLQKQTGWVGTDARS